VTGQKREIHTKKKKNSPQKKRGYEHWNKKKGRKGVGGLLGGGEQRKTGKTVEDLFTWCGELVRGGIEVQVDIQKKLGYVIRQKTTEASRY